MSNRQKFQPALSYDFLTRFYDKAIKLFMPEGFREKFVAQINPQANDNILDFGAGTAETSILLSKKNPAAIITAVDIDAKVRSIALKKIYRQQLDIAFDLYNGGRLAYADGAFSKVASCLVFHHLSSQQKTNILKELYRVLQPGGCLYICDWGLERNKFKRKLLPALKYFPSFKNTYENAKGLLPAYIKAAGFIAISEDDFMLTKSGTLSYYSARK